MKKLMAAALAAMMVLSLSACGGGSDSSESSSEAASVSSAADPKTSEVTADGLAKKMVEATTFQDEVIAISAEIVPNYYTIPDSVKEYAVYMCPTGAHCGGDLGLSHQRCSCCGKDDSDPSGSPHRRV